MEIFSLMYFLNHIYGYSHHLYLKPHIKYNSMNNDLPNYVTIAADVFS